MLRQFVPNNDELQVVIELLLQEFCLEGRKGLDDPHNILMRTDSSGIKQERIRNLVPLREKLPVRISGVSAQKKLINCVLKTLNLFCLDYKQLLFFHLFGDGNRSSYL